VNETTMKHFLKMNFLDAFSLLFIANNAIFKKN